MRVSTDEQATQAQEMELHSAGCDTIVQKHGSGASRARPALAKLVREIGAGETLVVVRLDRLARSVSHLIEVIEDLTAKGAHFRSLRIRPYWPHTRTLAVSARERIKRYRKPGEQPTS